MGLGFRILGLGFGVLGLGFRVFFSRLGGRVWEIERRTSVSLQYLACLARAFEGRPYGTTTVNPRKLEHGFRRISAGIPYTLL